MKNIASRFALEMDSIYSFVDVILSAIVLSKADFKGIHSRKKCFITAKKLKEAVNSGGNLTVVAYDGAFLSSCAEFELCIRSLIEKYIDRAANKCVVYNHLPKEIRDWYPIGCSNILLNLKQDKFSHITQDNVINSIASCVNPSPKKGYNLLGEAFSDNTRNFWPNEIDEFFSKRLGISKIWQKMSRAIQFQKMMGVSNESSAENVGRKKLTNLIQRRNDIIHRGKSYYTPSDTEVKECAEYFKIFVVSLAEVLEKQIAAI
jgi:hypothetical protein